MKQHKPPKLAAAETTGRRFEMLPPTAFYLDRTECNATVFDLRDSRAVERLHRGRALWQGRSEIEALDEDYFVSIRQPGSIDADIGTSTARGEQRG